MTNGESRGGKNAPRAACKFVALKVLRRFRDILPLTVDAFVVWLRGRQIRRHDRVAIIGAYCQRTVVTVSGVARPSWPRARPLSNGNHLMEADRLIDGKDNIGAPRVVEEEGGGGGDGGIG